MTTVMIFDPEQQRQMQNASKKYEGRLAFLGA
jgi:hypothetical protein